MNFIANESPEKLRGGFYTDPDIARFLARWVLRGQPATVLEPSCGDGAFLAALLAERGASLRNIAAWELDPGEAGKARGRCRAGGNLQVEVHPGDFLQWFVLAEAQAPRFDAVVGNPPFIRYQYLSDTQQWLAERIFTRFRLSFTKHTNAWVPFVLASLSLLQPGGRLGMVVPAEILHIRHAQPLREFLLAQCARTVILDPEELWFGGALQGVVLLLAEKKRKSDSDPGTLALLPVRTREVLLQDPEQVLERAAFVPGRELGPKWMTSLLTPSERALLQGLRANPRFRLFAELASVDVGVVTGANKFFLVPDGVVETFGLQPWAHPMFGRSEHVPGVIYSAEDHLANRRAGLPTNFLWFDAAEVGAFPPLVQTYLQTGVDQGLPKRFKCRVRQPWYRVPSVYATEVGMLKRAHHFPRLILNAAQAFTTDTAYRIKPRQTTALSLVYSFVNSLTCLCAELEGRHYGGGVLELVPSEIERLLMPAYPATAAELTELDQRLRSCGAEESLLLEQDQIVLAAAGLSAPDRSALHNAWQKLRKRRQRDSSPAPDSSPGE